MLPARARLIFALDVGSQEEAWRYLELLKDEVGLFKVGLRLYLAQGPALLAALLHYLKPQRLFLDLKLYDIPSTVLGALQTLPAGLGLVTVPSDLGPTALQAIVAGTGQNILAVTVLTSAAGVDLQALGYQSDYTRNLQRLVVDRARMAKDAGCRGVVCSGREAAAVKKVCGPDFLVVCPGIRLEGGGVLKDDQSRTATPYEAIRAGADYLVVGRPIHTAADPVAAARRVVREIERGLQDRAG